MISSPSTTPSTSWRQAVRRPAVVLVLSALCGLGLVTSQTLLTPTAHAQTAPSPATAEPSQSASWATALALFSRAAGGDEASIEPAAEAFSALLQQHPGDAVLMAYSGSATAMRARTTMLPWKKMHYADDGLALLDKALALLSPAHNTPSARGVPAALEIKLTAATTFLALPSLFNRHERGLKLLAEVTSSPLLPNTPAAFQAAVARTQRKASGG